jgi:hypothetical protein
MPSDAAYCKDHDSPISTTATDKFVEWNFCDVDLFWEFRTPPHQPQLCHSVQTHHELVMRMPEAPFDRIAPR